MRRGSFHFGFNSLWFRFPNSGPGPGRFAAASALCPFCRSGMRVSGLPAFIIRSLSSFFFISSGPAGGRAGFRAGGRAGGSGHRAGRRRHRHRAAQPWAGRQLIPISGFGPGRLGHGPGPAGPGGWAGLHTGPGRQLRPAITSTG